MIPYLIFVAGDDVLPVVGECVQQQYTVIYWPSSLDTIICAGEDTGERNSPLTLTQPPQTPGVDVPFGIDREDLGELWLWEPPLEPFIFSGYDDLNIPLFLTPADEFPLFAVEPFEFAPLLQVYNDLEWAAVLISGADNFDPFLGGMGQLAYGDNVCRILEEIQRHLLEPVIDQGQSWQLWSEDEVRKSFSERLERFLLRTGITRERIQIQGIIATQLTVDIPESVIQIRRVQWLEGGVRTTLPPLDQMQTDNASPGWRQTLGTPSGFIEQPQPSLKIQLVPPPIAAGDLELIVVQRPTSLSACAAMPIPAMFSPYIKWGVLADLLVKEGEANDPERATYCEKRYEEGVDLARALLGSKE